MSLVRSLSLACLASLLAAGCAPRAPAPAGPAITRPAATVERAAVRRVLAERRAVTVQRFLAYRDAQVYPFNPGPGTAHLWIEAPVARVEPEGRLSWWNRLYDTHPPIEQRIQALREL